jgi:F-type H+-transporting ATPase subunit epsilon
MEKNFTLEVVTPARRVINREVNSIVLPTSNGYMGVLVNHAPLINTLGVGTLKYADTGKEEHITICGGFMEISNNKVSIMADAAEGASEIDVDRAMRAEERARERLKSRDGVDVLRAELALRRALARLQTAKLG